MSGIFVICNEGPGKGYETYLASLDPPMWSHLSAHSLYTHGIALYGDGRTAQYIADDVLAKTGMVGPFTVKELVVKDLE
jgi:hypothetical protein